MCSHSHIIHESYAKTDTKMSSPDQVRSTRVNLQDTERIPMKVTWAPEAHWSGNEEKEVQRQSDIMLELMGCADLDRTLQALNAGEDGSSLAGLPTVVVASKYGNIPALKILEQHGASFDITIPYKRPDYGIGVPVDSVTAIFLNPHASGKMGVIRMLLGSRGKTNDLLAEAAEKIHKWQGINYLLKSGKFSFASCKTALEAAQWRYEHEVHYEEDYVLHGRRYDDGFDMAKFNKDLIANHIASWPLRNKEKSPFTQAAWNAAPTYQNMLAQLSQKKKCIFSFNDPKI